MEGRGAWRVVGLWRVWDDLPEAPIPTERPPEALVERRVALFRHEPDAREVRGAFARDRDSLERTVEEDDLIGHLVLDERTWGDLRTRPGWEATDERRHPPGGPHLAELAAYGLGPDRLVGSKGSVWEPAKDYGPSLERVAERLRLLGDSMGLTPAEFGPDVPFFEGRRTGGRTRQRRRDRGDGERDDDRGPRTPLDGSRRGKEPSRGALGGRGTSDEARASIDDEGALRREALEAGIHSHAMEGMVVDPARYPEFEAIVDGRMTFDEAAKALIARYRKA